MKKQILSLLACTAVLLGGCAQQSATEGTSAPTSVPSTAAPTTLPTGTPISLTDPVPTKRSDVIDSISGFGDWAFHYTSPEQMLNDDRIAVVVEGTVLSSKFVNLSNNEVNPNSLVPKTKCMLSVEHVYKGDLTEGQQICVVEDGGFVPAKLQYDLEYKAKFGDVPDYTGPDGVVAYRTCNYKVCEPGERVILFLYEYKYDSPDAMHGFYVGEGETYYSVANTIQGKYLLTPAHTLTRSGETISTDGCYLPYIIEDFINYDDTVFTLDSFQQFVQENLNDKN